MTYNQRREWTRLCRKGRLRMILLEAMEAGEPLTLVAMARRAECPPTTARTLHAELVAEGLDDREVVSAETERVIQERVAAVRAAKFRRWRLGRPTSLTGRELDLILPSTPDGPESHLDMHD